MMLYRKYRQIKRFGSYLCVAKRYTFVAPLAISPCVMMRLCAMRIYIHRVYRLHLHG